MRTTLSGFREFADADLYKRVLFERERRRTGFLSVHQMLSCIERSDAWLKSVFSRRGLYDPSEMGKKLRRGETVCSGAGPFQSTIIPLKRKPVTMVDVANSSDLRAVAKKYSDKLFGGGNDPT